jgi:hypothetical protein
VAGAIAKLHGDNRFGGTVKLNLTGSGGQSFGCFGVRGMEVRLVGEANDYVCKGGWRALLARVLGCCGWAAGLCCWDWLSPVTCGSSCVARPRRKTPSRPPP